MKEVDHAERAGARVAQERVGPVHGTADPLRDTPRMVAQRARIAAAFGPVAQREGMPKDEGPLQARAAPSAMAPNETGMPNQLKAGIEALSGMDMSDVRVHSNSDRPAQLNALAYAQGNDIHLGPGQEQHLPHEAWHVVQQRQGRVQATMQMAGVRVNDDAGLEGEADVMGGRAWGGVAQLVVDGRRQDQACGVHSTPAVHSGVAQLREVAVSGGTFVDEHYSAQNRSSKQLSRGARMILEFKPCPNLRAKEVSLVQTTNSNVVNLDDPHTPDQPESLLDQRRTVGGTAIDQQIFIPEKRVLINPMKPPVIKPAVVNLDPRYHEERHSVDDPLYNPRAIQEGGGQAAIEYTEKQKQEGGEDRRWRSAWLKDEPGHTVKLGQRLRGGETFEVAAMADGEAFIGSVRWGWKIDDASQNAVLDPASIELVSYGAASREFFAAAQAWNEMPVYDLKTRLTYNTIQLPTLAKTRKTARLTLWLRSVLERYPGAQQFHFSALTESEIGEFALTGKIASWELGGVEDGPADHEAILSRSVNDLLEIYPQGAPRLATISEAALGEFIVTGAIAAWERM